MGFLSPWFLAGVAAVGLPLWLHLLRRFRRTPRPFSSLMFFERRVQSSTRHRRLRYLALLALRMALLILMAVAFANPFVDRRTASAPRRLLTVIAIDRSFSMRAGHRMADAKTEAHRFLSGLGEHALAQVAAFDSHLEVLTQPQSGKAALNAVIDSLQAGDGASSYGELTRSLRVLEQTSAMQIDAHIFTDSQQTSMPPAFSDLQVGPHISLAVHCVGRKTPNWAVESVDVPSRVYGAAPVRVTTSVAGWQTGNTTRRVSLELDGRTVASKVITLPAGGRAQIGFDSFEIPHGAHRGRVHLDPPDDLPQDDNFIFSVERSDVRPVAFLYASGRARESLYYKAALEAAPGGGLLVQPFPVEHLAELELSRYAFIVLNDPGPLDRGASDKVSGYIAKGGSAFIAVGPATASEHVVPIAGNSVALDSGIQTAGEIDSQSAALTGAGRFDNVQFVRSARLLPKSGDRTLARLANGSPLLLEQHLGEGRILLFAGTLDNTVSDFPLHTSFLPFVAQTAAYLAGMQTDPSSAVVGTAVALRNSNAQTAAADLTGPAGNHLLTLNESTRVMSYPLTQEGFYEVQRAGGHRTLLAVHADRRESDLTSIPSETLDLWRNTGASASDPSPGAANAPVRLNLWRFFLTLALVAAFVESIFGMRYLRQAA